MKQLLSLSFTTLLKQLSTLLFGFIFRSWATVVIQKLLHEKSGTLQGDSGLDN